MVFFRAWSGLQSIDDCSEIHVERFSAREVKYRPNFDVFSDFLSFLTSSGGRIVIAKLSGASTVNRLA